MYKPVLCILLISVPFAHPALWYELLLYII